MRFIAVLLLIGFSSTSFAHHSRAEFSDETVELEGILTDVIWRSPHVALFLNVVDGAGEEQAWRVEAFNSPYAYEQMGVPRDTFQIGDRITIAGQVSTRRDFYFLGTNVLLPDGTEAVMSVRLEPYWSGPHIGGAAEFQDSRPQVIDAETEDLGVFRVWSFVSYGTSHQQFREEAIEARDDWDVTDNPLTRCEQPGMPATMWQPLSFELIEGGRSIILHHPWFDTRRTIHMDESLNSEEQQSSHLGVSIGRREGDTLVVRTTNIDWPYFDSQGTPLGEDAEVIERFTLSEDQTRLDFQITVNDSQTLTEPASLDRQYLALGEELQVLDCNVF